MKMLLLVLSLCAGLTACVGYVDRGDTRGGRGDRDGDGISNRNDRDRDGDGVRNRSDSRPNDPRRY